MSNEFYAILTPDGEGGFALPVVATFGRPVAVEVDTGETYPDPADPENELPAIVSHPPSIWRKPDAVLVALGLIKGAETAFDTARLVKTGHSDAIVDNRLVRTPTTATRPDAHIAPLRKLRARVDGLLEQHLKAGIDVTIDSEAKVLQTTARTYENVAGYVAAINAGVALPFNSDGTPNGAGTGTHVKWRMRDKTYAVLDGATFVAAIGVPAMAYAAACNAAAHAHKDALDALIADPETTLDDAEAYDLTTLWPAAAAPEDPA